jgi:HTH-type transcriptional regulator / antitoxin HigA
MTLTFDRQTYANLLSEVSPVPIRTDAEYQRALTIVESLMHKTNSTPEEDQLLELFVILVEKFEIEQYPAQQLSTPHSRLIHLMESNNLQAQDLEALLGSNPIAAEIMAGTRTISANDAQKLADRFHLPVKLFLS